MARADTTRPPDDAPQRSRGAVPAPRRGGLVRSGRSRRVVAGRAALREAAVRALPAAGARLLRAPRWTWPVLGACAAVAYVLLAGREGYQQVADPPWDVVQTWRWYGLLSGTHATSAGLRGAVAGAQPRTLQAWDWAGLLTAPRSAVAAHLCGAASWLCLLVLAVCWCGVLARARAALLTLRGVALIGLAWWAPFALGPPLTSLDVYSYAAQGVLQLHGGDPYRDSPTDLGVSAVLAAVDPRWRSVHSPYGPVASVAELAAAALGGGHPTATVLWLRAGAVAATAAAVVAAVALAAPARRTTTLVLLALDPLVLTSAVSACHLEALVLALALPAVLAERAGRHRLALVLSLLAALVKAPAVVLTAFLLVRAARTAAPGPDRRRAVAGDLAVLAAVALAVSAAVPDAWGWLRSVVSTPLSSRVRWTPSTALAHALAGGLALVGVRGASARVLPVCQVLGELVSVALVLRLLHRGRAAWAAAAGAALLVVALGGGVCYPWYLLWGVPLVAAAGTGRQAVAAAGGACAYALLYLVPSGGDVAVPVRAAVRAAGPLPLAALAAVAAAAACAVVAARWRAVATAGAVSREGR